MGEFRHPSGGSVGERDDIFIGNDEGPFNPNKWVFALGGGFLDFHFTRSAICPKFPAGSIFTDCPTRALR